MSVSQDLKNYFIIPAHVLGNKAKSFMFHIYVLHEEDKSISLDTKAHHRISEDHLQGYLFMESKGYRLLVENIQKSILFLELGIHENDLLVIDRAKTSEKKEVVSYLEQKEIFLQELEKFNFSIAWKQSLKSNNYQTIIEFTRKEIFCFPINESITISNARLLAETMVDDNLINRTVALSFHFAKILGINDLNEIGALVCAAFLKDIGTLFLNYQFENIPIETIDRALQKDYAKHPKITLFMLQKMGMELSADCLQIIEQHHETPDGLGFPAGSVGAAINPLSQVLGIVDQFIRFLAGHIVKTKLTAQEVLTLWEKGENPQGMRMYHEEFQKQFKGMLRSAS